MKIIISETQLEKILVESNMIDEQNDPTNDQRTLIVLQNKINDIINKKEKEILDQTSIKIVGNAQAIKLQLGKKLYDMTLMVPGVYAMVIPPNSTVSFGGSSMSTLFPEIEKIPEYKTLIEKYPEIKTQIEKGTINGVVYTSEQEQGTFKFTVTKKLEDMKDAKLSVPFGTEYPLGEFMERNKLIYNFKNGLFGTLESGYLSMNVSGAQLTLQTAAPEVPTAPIQVKTMSIGDLFNYDDVKFKDEAVVNQQLASFVQQIKEYIQKFGEPFIAHVKSQNPTVLGYSSIDGDPQQAIKGGYVPCSGNKTRMEYDLCLSQERAKIIADMLNKQIPELNGAFKFKGMGETTKWGPGWTQESPTIPEKTAPNRRYVLTQMQPFVGKATPTAQPAK